MTAKFVLAHISFLLLLIFCSVHTATAERVALVIGNSEYATAPLKNPVHDATDMAKALKLSGFKVDLITNGNQRQIEEAIQRLGGKLRSDENNIGLFYFAGHGVQVNNVNYLIPISAQIKGEADVRYEAVDANRVLSHMEKAENIVNLVFLDACRNNPFERSFRSTTRGLAQMDSPKGSLVAFATAPGSVAADGTGRNGVYTKYLLDAIATPGIEIGRVMRKVRRNVQKETGGRQTPFELSSLIGDFYFTPPVKTKPKPAPAITVQPPTTFKMDGEEELWALVKDSDLLDDIQVYIITYPKGRFIAAANLKLKRIKRKQASQKKSIVEKKPEIKAEKEIPKPQAVAKPKPAPIVISPPQAVVLASIPETSVTDDPPIAIKKEQKSIIKTDRTLDKNYIEPITGMEFVLVPAGCFEMGAVIKDAKTDDNPAHQVCLDDFYIGKYEVTQQDYHKLGLKDPTTPHLGGHQAKRKGFAASFVSWLDTKYFINKINLRSKIEFRLPTEAEWEYAARSGGDKQKYAGSNSINKVSWHKNNSSIAGGYLGDIEQHKVGKKQPNSLGIYDMSGSVWEWCQDYYAADYYLKSPKNNPQGPNVGLDRVKRGGSFKSRAMEHRTMNRSKDETTVRDDDVGFRIIFSASAL